jgi:two-component system, chemotaxis family, sensor kinase CheA
MNRAGRNTLKEEANGLLSSLEDFLLELERVPDDLELVRRVFSDLRAARESEEDDLPVLIDKARVVYDKVRNGEIRVIRKLIDIVLEARDSLRSIIDGQETEGPALRTAFIALKGLAFEETEGLPRPRQNRRRPGNRGPRDVSG